MFLPHTINGIKYFYYYFLLLYMCPIKKTKDLLYYFAQQARIYPNEYRNIYGKFNLDEYLYL